MTEITTLSDNRIDIFTKYNENQLFHIYEPEAGLFIAESPEVIKRAINAKYDPVSFLVQSENITDSVLETMEMCDVPVYVGPGDVLKDIPGYGLTRGMLCAFRRRTLPSLEDILNNSKTIAILEDVMNPTNVGAIIRSAAALNIDALVLTQGCSDPLYRRAARVSMGTVFQVPWTVIDKRTIWPDDAISTIKNAGYNVVATALMDDTLDIRDPKVHDRSKKLAIMLGTEGTGIKNETLKLCDHTVKIPMSHNVDSLNVTAASAVTFWEFTRDL